MSTKLVKLAKAQKKELQNLCQKAIKGQKIKTGDHSLWLGDIADCISLFDYIIQNPTKYSQIINKAWQLDTDVRYDLISPQIWEILSNN